jgi:hypothetical protein
MMFTLCSTCNYGTDHIVHDISVLLNHSVMDNPIKRVHFSSTMNKMGVSDCGWGSLPF